jgi:hypothetical protein
MLFATRMGRRLPPLAAAVLLLLPGCGQDRRAAPEPAKTVPSAATPSPPAPPSPAGLSEQHLEAADGAAFDHLGFSVAAGEDAVVSGARFADAGGEDSGAVYAFHRDPTGWSEKAKLVPADPFAHDHFGNSVALDGDTLVVGAPAHHELGRKVGSAYVFRYRGGSWEQEAKLSAPEAARFGQAVAVSGDRLVVGAPGGIVNGAVTGAAYVFRRRGSSWRREARLSAGDAKPDHLFGLAVGISGDTVAVGASGDDERGSLTGAAYVFRADGDRWRQEAKLLADDAAALSELGKAIAIDSDRVVVGADGVSETGGRIGKFSGAAYVFRQRDGAWHQEAELLADDRKGGDRFGNAVAIYLDRIVVGSHFADPAGLNSGAAYVFRRQGEQWRQERKLVPAQGAPGEEFGNAVAVHKNLLVAGALRGGSRGTAAGAVSIYEGRTP